MAQADTKNYRSAAFGWAGFGATFGAAFGWSVWSICLVLLASGGCTHNEEGPLARYPLVINEVMTNNDAAWVDDHGETEDWVELANISDKSLSLDDFTLGDSAGQSYQLPAQELAPGQKVVLFADKELEQGALHLPFKLSSTGDTLSLENSDGTLIDAVDIPALEVNDVYARFGKATPGKFATCRYATPERDNGASCEPPAPPALEDNTVWRPYTWPKPWPVPAGPLVLSELALRPARFIEVLNTSNASVALADYALRAAPLPPGQPWPLLADGQAIDWISSTTGKAVKSLAPGERIAVKLTAAQLATLESDPVFEGVVTVFDSAGGMVDRVDFMRWPSEAVLTRMPDADGRLRFCKTASEGAENTACDPLMSRDVGDRVRHLYTPGDYAALAAGDTSRSLVGVKFVVDMDSGDQVHLLSTRGWALHYTWIREQIDHEPKLDRCDPKQSADFDAGWRAFSDVQYAKVAGRRYLLGTLDTFASSGIKAVDYTVGDQITADLMLRGYFDVLAHADSEDLSQWKLHPNEQRQITELQTVDGQAPIIGLNAPFRDQRYQPLTIGSTFGTLKFVRADEIASTPLGPDVILVTDAVPNDIPFVGGLITEAFQTPLAHVNVLSANRNTPNMALRDARTDKALAPFLDKLVKLDVTGEGFKLAIAKPEDADAFWQSRMPTGPRVIPRLDTTVRGVVDLRTRSIADLPAIGAKAAQLAELGHITSTAVACHAPVPIPELPFAIPLVHYLEHFDKSGAKQLLTDLMKDAKFRGDPVVRDAGLERVRQAILKTPIDATILAQVSAAASSRWGAIPLRFRSSSNTEDLPGFNGAGLYVSIAGTLGDPKESIEDAIRGVWASLWNTRAYDEREFGHIDQSGVAMGILVHPAFKSERANIIVISRDVLDPARSDIHYMNAQIGEASVANPAPGVVTEQLVHHWRLIPGTPEIEYQSKSSLSHGSNVLSLSEVQTISCFITAIHNHFQTVLDPNHTNRWFAIDSEVKLAGDDRHVVFKQARPYSFGRADVPADCREF